MKKMKQSTKLIILASSLAVIIAAAVLAYNFFGKNYTPYDDSSQSDSSSQKESVSAPDFTVYDSEGSPLHLSDFNGKPKVVNFWATWCGRVSRSFLRLIICIKNTKIRLIFLMVNLTDGYKETVTGVQKNSLNKTGIRFRYIFDTSGSAAYTYNVYSIPQTVFIDNSGNIYGIYPGAMDEQRLEGYINDILQ